MNQEDVLWREATIAHFALAGQLMAAALSLELACTLLDEEGDDLYQQLAEILPSDDPTVEGFDNDREFLLDRARNFRLVAERCAENGASLAEALANSLREDAGQPDSWNRRDELLKALVPYAESVTSAAAEAERALSALDGSVSETGYVEPAEITAGIVRFLNSESALFSSFNNRQN